MLKNISGLSAVFLSLLLIACSSTRLSTRKANPNTALESGSTVVVYEENFESYVIGKQWHNIDETVVVGDCGQDGRKCLRVAYIPNEIGSARLETSVLVENSSHYRLQYDLLFEKGFEFVKGGKLPGLGPSQHTTGCVPSKKHGWSIRPMWRSKGRVQGYYYGQETGPCGEGAYSLEGVLSVGTWHHLDIELKLNSASDSFDGLVIIRVDGKVVSRSDNVRFREEISDRSDITKFFFSTFYGGNDPSWAPSKTRYIRFDNFRILGYSNDL